MTKWISKLVKIVIRKENKCIIAKLGCLSKKNTKKLYKSMIVYLTSKILADKFHEQGLFKLKNENIYTNL